MKMLLTPAECMALTVADRSLTVPCVSGYWISTPLRSLTLLKSVDSTSHSATSQPMTLE